MAVIKGKELMVFKKTDTTYKSIAHATNHTLNLSSEEVDVSDKDSGDYGSTIPGMKSWDIQAEHVYDDTEADGLIDAWQSGEELDLVWGMKNEDAASVPVGGWTPKTGGYEGEAIITSLTINAPSGDKASYTVTFKGKGEFKKRSQS